MKLYEFLLHKFLAMFLLTVEANAKFFSRQFIGAHRVSFNFVGINILHSIFL